MTMTPLEAARELAENSASGDDHCPHCHEFIQEGFGAHRDDCPWLMLPQIVAVLEAAEATARYAEDIILKTGDCPICGDVDVLKHLSYCPLAGLLAAHGIAFGEF